MFANNELRYLTFITRVPVMLLTSMIQRHALIDKHAPAIGASACGFKSLPVMAEIVSMGGTSKYVRSK